MLNIDPAFLDQDKIRLDKRRKLFLYALIPIIVMFLVGLFFLRTGIYNLIYSVGIKSDGRGLASTATKLQLAGNFLEPYLPYYNSGYLKLLQADSRETLQSAESDFNESLKFNPPEVTLCAIYGNLSYSIELQGDLSFENNDFSEALVLYNHAESLLYENDCVSKEQPSKESKDEKSKIAQKRIEEKRRKTVDLANGNQDTSSGDNGSDNSGEPQEISDGELRQLLEQQQETIKNAAGNPYSGHGNAASSSKFGEPNF